MTTFIKLTRVYKKEFAIQVNPEELKGMTKEEIGEHLINVHDTGKYEKFFEVLPIEEIGFHESDEADTDRFDIYDEDNKHIYGGHL